MNIKTFKKLIKEAVIEAIHEELPDIINETLSGKDKQIIKENKSFLFNSSDVPQLSRDVRNSLASKMGLEFGFQQQPHNSLQVINDVNKETGEKTNPYLNFILDAANNMTPMDRSGLINLE